MHCLNTIYRKDQTLKNENKHGMVAGFASGNARKKFSAELLGHESVTRKVRDKMSEKFVKITAKKCGLSSVTGTPY